jgi:tetratricopeptide (TPR) repeat protein
LKTPTHPDPAATISVDEVQRALAAIVASPAFSASPQLAAFLRFVVEAALDGQSDRIKGYTIAIEALGRDASFDPQSDPIVRVEAGRLRRALDRYYAEAGQNDPIVIELPRGSYVPVFERRTLPPPQPIVERSVFGSIARVVAFPESTTWIALGLGLMGYAVVDLVVLDQLHLGTREQTAAALSPQPAHADDKRPFVGPSIYIAPVMVSGNPILLAPTSSMLEVRLRDVFARFDDITVISELPHASQRRQPADYRLVTAIEPAANGTSNLRFQLIDSADGSIAWTRTVERLDTSTDQRYAQAGLVHEIAGELLQPFGVIHARERAKEAARHDRDPRYACLLQAFQYFRGADRTQHESVRACLQAAVTSDPSFASGFSSLARVYYREYMFGLPEEAATRALDRALNAARNAIDVNPSNVRAYHVLMDIHMARGEIGEAMAAGDRALALNPYDSDGAIQYASHLVLLGDVDRGVAMLRERVRYVGTMPMRYTSVLAIAAYLKSDFTTALAYANQLASDEFPFGLVIQAAARTNIGDREGAQAAAMRLAELRPNWRKDPRRELKKYLPLPWIVDRIEADLRAAGLGETMASSPAEPPSITKSPILSIESIEHRGSRPPSSEADTLREQIVKTFSRFEDIDIVAPSVLPDSVPSVAERPDYRLLVTATSEDDGLTVAARLVDGEDGTTLWSRTFERVRADQDGAFSFVSEMAGTLLHPIGTVATRERLRTSDRPGSARYHCMLEASDYLRSFATARHAKARDCLEEAVAADPRFASGFTALARIYLREHQFGIQGRPDDIPPLGRAQAAAERAMTLNPNSARAHFVMFDICAAKGDLEGVRRHGEVALVLNPNDQSVVFHYGLQLIMMGDVSTGLRHVQRVAEGTSVPPARLDFALFLANYLQGDMAEASRHAKRIANDSFVPGHLARALTAYFGEDPRIARRMIDRLAAVDGGWVSDPRAQLAKFITTPELVEKLARDLLAVGLGTPQRASKNTPVPTVAVR